MNSFRTIIAFMFLMAYSTLRAQHIDSVQLDLKRLSGIEFFKKYSFYDTSASNEYTKVTKLIWSLHHLRTVNDSLKHKGVKTITII